MARMTPPTLDVPGRLPAEEAGFRCVWQIERNFVRIRWIIVGVWLVLIPVVPIISVPLMLVVAGTYGIANAALYFMTRRAPTHQRLLNVQRLATGIGWAGAIGAIAVVADQLVLVVPGGLVVLVVLTGLRFRLRGTFIATGCASLIIVGAFAWHGIVRDDIVHKTAIAGALLWIAVFHVMGVIVGVVVHESDTARQQDALQREIEHLDTVRRAENQREADMAAFEQERTRRETEFVNAAMCWNRALDALMTQKDAAAAELAAQLDAANAELTTCRLQQHRLSEHERDILQLLPQADLTYADIGLQLYLAESSVKTYVHRIGVKLGLTGRITRTAVVAAAYEQEILQKQG